MFAGDSVFSTKNVDKPMYKCYLLCFILIICTKLLVDKHIWLGKTINTITKYPHGQICPHTYPHTKIVETVEKYIKSVVFYLNFVDKLK